MVWAAQSSVLPSSLFLFSSSAAFFASGSVLSSLYAAAVMTVQETGAADLNSVPVIALAMLPD